MKNYFIKSLFLFDHALKPFYFYYSLSYSYYFYSTAKNSISLFDIHSVQFLAMNNVRNIDSLFMIDKFNKPIIILSDSFYKNLSLLSQDDRNKIIIIVENLSHDILYLMVVRCFILNFLILNKDFNYLADTYASYFNRARRPVLRILDELGVELKDFSENLAHLRHMDVDRLDTISPPPVNDIDPKDPLNKIYIDLYKLIILRLSGSIDRPIPEHYKIMECCWMYAQFYKFLLDNPSACKVFGWSDDWAFHTSLISKYITDWLSSAKPHTLKKGSVVRNKYALGVRSSLNDFLYDVDNKLMDMFNRSEADAELLLYIHSRFVESAFNEISVNEILDVIKVREGEKKWRSVEGGKKKTPIDVSTRVTWNDPQFNRVNHMIDVIVDSKCISPVLCKSNAMDFESTFMTSAYNIINNTYLLDKEKEICIEILALYYEKNFASEVIHSIANSAESLNPNLHSLLVSVFTRSYEYLSKRVEILRVKNTTKKLIENITAKPSSSSLNDTSSTTSSSSSIQRKTKFMVILNCLGVDAVCNIVFNAVVRLCGSKGGAEEMSLITEISQQVIKHMENLKEKDLAGVNPILRRYFLENRDAILLTSSSDVVEIGQGLLDILLDCYDELFVRKYDFKINCSKPHTVNYVFIRDKYEAFLSNFIFNPLRLPMLCPPLLSHPGDYSNGGYLYSPYNRLVNKSIVHQNPLNKMPSAIGMLQYNTVNYLNSQSFVINRDMLEFLKAEWVKDDSLIFGVYNKPLQVSADEKLVNIRKHNSLYWMYRNILNIAILYQDQVVYFPTFLDFRGRVYPLVNFLSYQGGDIARSLLLFKANKKVVEKNSNDIDYLYIYLSDVFGGNKISRSSRISWAKTHLDIMYKLYHEDRNNFYINYLSKAKEKAQFMACFLALSKIKQGWTPDESVPVLFDATCSGMQHLSSLTTDITLASMVNIISGDKPSDFYEICAERVRLWIENIDDLEVRDKLLELKLDRKLMKIPVMTIPYNIGLEGLSDKITENFEKYYVERVENGEKVHKLMFKVSGEFTVSGKELILTGREGGKLGSIVYKVVNSMMPPIQALKNYFHKIIVILKHIKKPMFWITPAGMKVWASERLTNVKKVKSTILKSSKPVTVHLPTDSYDYKSIERGLMANFIHSLDAANIHILVYLIQQDLGLESRLNLYTIHDCFASTSSEMPHIEVYVKSAFAQLYFNEDYLKELHRSLMSQIESYASLDYLRYDEGLNSAIYKLELDSESWEVEVPEPPSMSCAENRVFFHRKIMESEYFIS